MDDGSFPGPMEQVPSVLVTRLGALAGAAGSGLFGPQLRALVAAIAPHDTLVVNHYATQGPPHFPVAGALSPEAIALYRGGFYRSDPFFRDWRRRRQGGVVNFRRMAGDALRSRYRTVFQREAGIDDELGLFLRMPGDVGLGLFLVRREGAFTAEEVACAATLYPAVAGLHRAHTGWLLERLLRHGAVPSDERWPEPVCLADADGRIIVVADDWHQHDITPRLKAWLRAGSEARRATLTTDGRRLHVERLPEDFGAAPGGWLVTCQRAAPAEDGLWQEALARLVAPLTAREGEVVRLVLEGHGIRNIAQRLGIAPGTVKNHRKHLFHKLDITTERELFLRFHEELRVLPAQPIAGPSGTAVAAPRTMVCSGS